MLITASAALFVAFASGALTGWFAMAAPTLLAIAVGLVLAHLVGWITTLVGGRMLNRGALISGLTLLNASRRPETRRMIAVITVASALCMFAANAVAVGERNRAATAEAVGGAPAVVTVDGDLPTVRDALASTDAVARHATPVALMETPGGGTAVQAVVPDEFARIAQFPGLEEISLAGIAPPKIPPVQVRGKQLSAQASTRGVPVEVGITVVDQDGQSHRVPWGKVRGARSARLTAEIPCAEGCSVSAVDVLSAGSSGSDVQATVSLRDVSTEGHVIDMGASGEWRNDSAPGDGEATKVSAGSGFLEVRATFLGGLVRITHASTPRTLPALVSGALPPGSEGGHFQAPGLDGVHRKMHRIGTLPYVPGGRARTSLVNQNVLVLDGVEQASPTRVQVWLDSDDPLLQQRLAQALEARGVMVEGTSTTAEIQRGYDRTASAWGLDFGAAAGVAAALLAALVLLIGVAAGWRSRVDDYVALRVNGLSVRQVSRVAWLEQVPWAILAAALGSACGLVGGDLAMADVPFFMHRPELDVLDVSSSGTAVLAATVGTSLLVALVAWVSSIWLTRRAKPQAIGGDAP